MQIKPALALAVLCLCFPASAFAQPDLRAQQQAACEDDAYRLCPDEVPDETRVTNCLARQKAKLSPGCRTMFNPPGRNRAGR
jgi:Cysteine rich repeat